MNDIDLWSCDVQNAFIRAPSYYIICGPEFGVHQGKRAIIVCALYGGVRSGRDYWLHLRSCIEFLGFSPRKADPDVWIRPAEKEDGSEYYEYVLLYVDNCLVLSENPEYIIRDQIGKYFTIKEESIGSPDHYLGGKV